MKERQVVIIGGGFGGLYAAKALRRLPVRLTLVDRHNYHLFQPLLYQVATGGLSPGDIASPLRGIVGQQKNTWVLQANVVDIEIGTARLVLKAHEPKEIIQGYLVGFVSQFVAFTIVPYFQLLFNN